MPENTLISDNTLFYFFSTIAQVLAATTALISIAIQFKISDIKKHLVGDGHATYKRANSTEIGYILDKKYLDRLRDSLARESLDGIEEVLKVLSNQEHNDGLSELERPRGLQFLYKRYKKMRSDINKLKSAIHNVVIYSFITIILSLLFIATTDLISNCPLYQLTELGIAFLLFFISLFKTYKGIKKGIFA